MASAESGGNIALLAAALSAMTNNKIVTKDEYHVLEQQSQSGIGPKYIFKGRIDVPQAIKRTYAVTQELFIESHFPQREESIEKNGLRFWGGLFLGVGGALVGAAGAAVATVAVVVTAPISVPLLVGTAAVVAGGTVAVAAGATAGGVFGAVAGNAAGGAIEFTAGHSTGGTKEVATGGGTREVATKILKDNDSYTSDIPEFIDKNQRTPVQIYITFSDGSERFLTIPSEQYTVIQLKVRIREVFGIEPEDQCLSYHDTPLNNTHTLASYNITNYSMIKSSVRVRGGELSYIDDKFRDLTLDYDFTDISDGDKKFMRGGHRYYRPCGWKRLAIKVLEKYPDGEAWLGMKGLAGEWAVTYHGTKKENFNGICEKGNKIGPREAYGRGVYSTPLIKIAERYGKEFQHNGISFNAVFQNRVNPKGMVIPDGAPNYWVCPDEKSIRPYGLCVKKV